MSVVCMLAVICLSVIWMSAETDAQPTVDETSLCGCSALEEATKVIKDEIRDQINNVKELFATKLIKCDADESSKQALVSALHSKCVPLLIQQNVDGSRVFHRSWAEFKVGFSDSRGNYWLGNELLSQLTVNGSYKLKFDLQSRSNRNWYYAEYSTFRVLTEAQNYRLQVSGYSGNAGGDALNHSNGMMFTTYDRDNDRWPRVNCAQRTGGGFWHKNCAHADVNADRSSIARHIFGWDGLPGGRALQSSRMWLQCK